MLTSLKVEVNCGNCGSKIPEELLEKILSFVLQDDGDLDTLLLVECPKCMSDCEKWTQN